MPEPDPLTITARKLYAAMRHVRRLQRRMERLMRNADAMTHAEVVEAKAAAREGMN